MSNARNIASGAKFVDTAGDSMTGNLTTTGNVGVGEASPNLGSSGTGLHIKGAASKLGIIKLDSQTANYSGRVQFTENGTDKWRIGYDATSNHLEFTRSGVADRVLISDDGYVTTPNQPSFNAYRSSSLTTNTGSSWQLMPDFTGTRFNNSNSFNAANGKFTAPVAGEYLFGVNNNMGSANNVKSWRLYINNSTSIVLSYADVSASWQNLSASTLVTLNANDYVQFAYKGQPDYGPDWLNIYGYLMG